MSKLLVVLTNGYDGILEIVKSSGEMTRMSPPTPEIPSKSCVPDLAICSICFQIPTTAYKYLKCKHLFCMVCLATWLKSGKNTCPYCRSVIDKI